MPALLERLRCGVIFTGAFIDHLREECARERLRAAAPSSGQGGGSPRIPVIHYVRCLDGDHKGGAWWSVCWERRDALAPDEVFGVAGVEVALPRQTQRGLKWRHVDFREGRVVVG